MPADVVMRAQGAILASHDDDAFAGHLDTSIVARHGDLLVAARQEPVAEKDPLALAVIDSVVEIISARQRALETSRKRPDVRIHAHSLTETANGALFGQHGWGRSAPRLSEHKCSRRSGEIGRRA